MGKKTLEDTVERATIDLCKSLGWSSQNLFYETFGPKGTLGRAHRGEVVLVSQLRPALAALNPGLPPAALQQAIDELCRDRSSKTLIAANQEIFKLLLDGVPVKVPRADGQGEQEPKVRVIDWNNPGNNHFFLAQQFWVQGSLYKCRADLVGFVNGLPLVFLELKGVYQNVKKAYDGNLSDYRTAIPQLFWFNALCLLSNGVDGRVGSFAAPWPYFKRWKRVAKEDEAPTVSLETLVLGTMDPTRLLDLCENFVLFSASKSETSKILGQNHQVLGVNRAFAAVQRLAALRLPRKPEDGRLGMFWHTQGSGKSYSMIFFAQKVLRKLPGNWTFVVVTDRDELDEQIYKTFAACGAASGEHVQAKSADHLQELLRSDKRYVFTLIQKFRTDVKGATYPCLSRRSDIIVMADEAHRSQYDTFAKNLRDALPNAAFIGFTGTPLMEGERTREFFGSYVSVYNFRQAIEDEATVPLYYEARVPELHLGPQDLTPELSRLVEDADLDEEQQRKVEREFKRQYHLITRSGRLETIAQDLVQHLLALKPGTKAMVVSVDKVTAGVMYQRVRAAWERHAATLRGKLEGLAADAPERRPLEATLAYLSETDMALVVSQSQNEGEIFKRKGLDITPHRQRMMKEDLDTRFKDEKDPLRVVFVCAMWMTGFDVPSCGVIYLDKPLRNHTLMQTIARANRVFEDKQSGVIDDYIGVFQNLNQALEIYGSQSGGGVREGDRPLRPKEVLVQELAAALGDAQALCQKRGVSLDAAPQRPPLARVRWIQDSVNKLVHPEAERRELLALASRVDRLYGAVGLSPAKDGLAAPWGALMDVAGALRALETPVDIAEFMARVEGVLDEAVAAEQPVIYGQKRVHLGQIDFQALSQHFHRSPLKQTVAAEVTAAATRRVRVLVNKNPLRKDLAAQLQELIDDYNAGAQSTGAFFERLLAFMLKLEEEAQRAEREGLTEESLALHDVLLSLPEVKLTEAEREQVKALARALPQRLAGKLVIDWRASQSGRAAVLSMIKDELDSGLPEAFGSDAYDKLCQAVFDHFYESYFGEGKSKYAEA